LSREGEELELRGWYSFKDLLSGALNDESFLSIRGVTARSSIVRPCRTPDDPEEEEGEENSFIREEETSPERSLRPDPGDSRDCLDGNERISRLDSVSRIGLIESFRSSLDRVALDETFPSFF
jgi:hypothetical protein